MLQAFTSRLLTACLLLGSAAPAPAQNILVIVLDDVGVDKIGAYGEHPGAGPTPVIDALAANGVLFRNAWSHPVCTPSRVSALTGRHPFRTCVGSINNTEHHLDLDVELTLPEVLGRAGYRTACLGKYHMASSLLPAEEEYRHPIDFGFDLHVGTLHNPMDYYGYRENIADARGTSQPFQTRYATTRTTDLAIRLIHAWSDHPWFIWLSYNAPHKPLHVPPRHLYTGPDLTGSEDDETLYRAVLEAVDTELSRLFARIDPAILAQTWVILVGDNGTYGSAMSAPFGQPHHDKGNVFEGGVNVPFIVFGPGVPAGRESAALVTTTDLFATAVEIASATHPAALPQDLSLDSESVLPYALAPELASVRPFVFAEWFQPSGPAPHPNRRAAARGERYKLIRRTGTGTAPNLPAEGFYDLLVDPFETQPLPPPLDTEQQAAYDALAAVLEQSQQVVSAGR